MEISLTDQFTNIHKKRLPNSWQMTKLGDCFEELYRYPTYYGIKYINNGIPEVRGELLKADGTIEEKSEAYRYVSRETANRFPRVHLEPNDFVMSVRGTMGKIAIVPESLNGAIITANLIRMKFSQTVISPNWARHFLRSDYFQESLNLATSATTIKTIQIPQLCNIVFPRPPVNEQNRIAEILDTIDEAIQKTDALIEKLKAMKQGLLHDLLTRGLGENGKLRDPKAHPEQFKDSPLLRIPREWKLIRVNNLLDRGILVEVQDGNHGEAHPKMGDFVSDGVPFLMAKDLQGGKIDFVGCHKITYRQYRSLRVGFAKPGDVLLTHKGSIGQTAIVPNGYSHIMLTPQVTLYRVGHKGLLMPEYLYWFFQSEAFQRRLDILAAQSTSAASHKFCPRFWQNNC